MEVLRLRSAGLRRARASGAGIAGVAAGLYLLAGLWATWPAVKQLDSRFLADAPRSHVRPVPGDYLQSTYELWLVGHQLEDGRAPWLDPYSFRPESSPRVNFAGWPFGLAYWPLHAAFGTVVAWNLLILLSFLAAGLVAYAWLRELELPEAAAAVGGVAFALAPYRVAQSAGHLLGLVAILIPLALWAFERGRRGSGAWFGLSAASLASIPLSGQVHLALGAIPFFAVYALVRTRRELRAIVAVITAVAAAIAAGVVVHSYAIAGSINAEGRSLSEVKHYSAHVSGFVSRNAPHASEKFVFLGWVTLLLAALGLVGLLATRRFGLAAVLGLGALVPALLALGTNFPLYSPLWHAFGAFRYPRVPERLLPITCLCLAALAAFAVSRARSRLVVPCILALLLFLDLHVRIYSAFSAGEASGAYAALAKKPPGRLLELPVFLPDRHEGSVYLYYDLEARRQRPLGYSTVAPVQADRTARRLRPLNCGDWGVHPGLAERLGVRHVVVHGELYEHNPPVRAACLPRAVRGLEAHGFRRIGIGDGVAVYAR
jgi:hypothetical protein